VLGAWILESSQNSKIIAIILTLQARKLMLRGQFVHITARGAEALW
jgi:hypothetical protein